jgi:hypothetical protein
LKKILVLQEFTDHSDVCGQGQIIPFPCLIIRLSEYKTAEINKKVTKEGQNIGFYGDYL